MPFDFESHQLCCVTNPRESGAIAKHPHITRDETGTFARWFNDAHHERCFRVDEVLRDEPGEFVFIERLPHGERCFAIRPMTLEAYCHHVREHLIDPYEFKNTEDVVDFFLTHGPYGCKHSACRFCGEPG